MLVRDVMTPNVPAIALEATLTVAAEKMLADHTDTLFVVKGERLVGTIGLRDLFTAPVPAHFEGATLRQPDLDALRQVWNRTRVEHLMNTNVLSVTEDTPLLKAAEIMINSGKHPLPVLRQGAVVGMITRQAVVRAVLAARHGEMNENR
jgi:CBS domain-containing protein